MACFPKDAGLDEACFKISYDILIVGVRLALGCGLIAVGWCPGAQHGGVGVLCW